MRWTTFTCLYPNAAFPALGTFVRERLRAALRRGGGEAAVVAPVPWFPPLPGLGTWSRWGRVPRREAEEGIDVLHPRFLLLPRISTRFHPRLLEAGAFRCVRRVSRGAALLDAHYLFPDGVAAIRIGRRLRLPVVVTARGSDVNLLPSIPAAAAQVRRSLASAAAVVAVSEELRRRLAAWSGFPEERVIVIGNGVDRTRFAPGDRLEARRRVGLPPSGRVLLAAARLAPGKRIDLLLEALALLPPAGRPLLACVGDGPDRLPLERRARERGVAGCVRFAGEKRPEEMPDWYRAADAFVLASDREGHPNVVLEALATGVPVVASAVGGVPETVDSTVGLLVPTNTADAFARAIEEVFRRRFDPAAFERRAARYSWDAVGERVASLFERVAAGAAGGGE
ncbi:MAG TPA: glycosyltransferase [Planctomycetota bacterium]|nr:glycosyltransferase [Planctomycetota bacterium]